MLELEWKVILFLNQLALFATTKPESLISFSSLYESEGYVLAQDCFFYM